MNFKINNGFHETLDSSDTAPPPLPPWLKGFLVTSRNKGDMRLAGEEIAKLCNDDFFKLAYDDVGVPRSMVKPGETEVPYDFAEALLVPGCPGSVFVALRPDNNTVNVRLIAEELIEEADKVGAAGWTKTSHTARLIPVESIAPEYDIEALAAKIIDEHFPRLDSAAGTHRWAHGGFPTFRVHYEEHSPAMHLHAMDVEKKIADMVPKEYEVNLTNPELTILVVVAGGSAMMSVVKGYGASEKFHHFRIHSAADLARTKSGSQPSSPVARSRATAA
jgi:hypothetical protein